MNQPSLLNSVSLTAHLPQGDGRADTHAVGLQSSSWTWGVTTSQGGQGCLMDPASGNVAVVAACSETD